MYLFSALRIGVTFISKEGHIIDVLQKNVLASCTVCDGKKTVTDESTGEVICNKCGTVLVENVEISEQPRAFSKEEFESRNQTFGWGPMGMMNVQTVQPLTIDNVKKAAQDFVKSLDNQNLAVKDIMEFEKNFYFIVYEKDTGMGAFEMLVWKDAQGMMVAGVMHPEPGPNMMWNSKYSMMQFAQPLKEMAITSDEAKSLAQKYLDANLSGTSVEDVDQFYGYYTVHTEKDGKISGMLSVNGYTGQIWYHSWHGQFIQELE